MLNLGLLYITFGAVIMAGRATRPRATLLWCLGAGILARLFLAWYDRSALVWLALAALIMMLVVTRKKPLILQWRQPYSLPFLAWISTIRFRPAM